MARYIMYGASPRASINLILTARALAFVRGRNYVMPQDVTDMALDVMRHRLVLSYEALSDGVTADRLLWKVLEAVPAPARCCRAMPRQIRNRCMTPSGSCSAWTGR